MNSFRLRVIDGKVGDGVRFERIRRITGYLSGSTERWNEGKTSELSDRVSHSLAGSSAKTEHNH